MIMIPVPFTLSIHKTWIRNVQLIPKNLNPRAPKLGRRAPFVLSSKYNNSEHSVFIKTPKNMPLCVLILIFLFGILSNQNFLRFQPLTPTKEKKGRGWSTWISGGLLSVQSHLTRRPRVKRRSERAESLGSMFLNWEGMNLSG